MFSVVRASFEQKRPSTGSPDARAETTLADSPSRAPFEVLRAL
jgi:hypothetical protein